MLLTRTNGGVDYVVGTNVWDAVNLRSATPNHRSVNVCSRKLVFLDLHGICTKFRIINVEKVLRGGEFVQNILYK